MILQSLARYYDYLIERKPDEIAHPGWCELFVIAKLELDAEGNLLNVVPAPEKRGWRMSVPNQVKRTSGRDANLLCDTSGFLLGIDPKSKLARTAECHANSVTKHEEILGDVDSVPAQAVLKFLRRWNPAEESDNLVIERYAERVLSGGKLVFTMEGRDVLDDPAVRRRVEEVYAEPPDGAARIVCLVSGKREPIARLHPSIKGVMGTKPSGASLVSFNEPAFESFGRKGKKKGQGLNSPVGVSSAFAYATALNYLIAQANHIVHLGDMTIVFWAEREDEVCSDAVARLLGSMGMRDREESSSVGGGFAAEADNMLTALMQTIRRGTLAEDYDVDAPFYVLGLAPNAGRLTVRFFWMSRFGDVVENLVRHYERIDICHAPFEWEYLTPYQLVKETENLRAKRPEASSALAGALMRSILSDTRYPESLYENVLLRIRATQNEGKPGNGKRGIRKVTRGRAAIIRAYLIKNLGKSEQEVTVALNEDRTYPAYVLGRIFSTLEEIQETASPGISATIVDKYFDSASATPAVVFPVIVELGMHHLQKLDRNKPGLAVMYRHRLGELVDRLDEFPKRLSVEDRGEFILGYFQQNQRRFEKKTKEA